MILQYDEGDYPSSMAILKVLNYGDPVLRKEAEKVLKVSAKIQKLVADMFDTMYAYNGVGLAAPQVGELKRIFVLDCSTDENPMPQMVFINPVIVKKESAIISREGCLSFPGVYTDVKRYESITVRYMDMKGKTQTMTVQDGTLLCRAIQHELDHLNGVLFVDHVIDRFTADQLLAEHHLPPIDPEKILSEPELDEALAGVAL
ncbi:MAG: peptide deformylase [Vampirovibrio sp.]|nr:peptide deformylase [Vampirovibrio sp.]